MKPLDLAWLAGLLEGEGAFHVVRYRTRVGKEIRSRAKITLMMNDKDVIDRAYSILKPTSKITFRMRANKLATMPSYMIQMESNRAVGWMLTLYSFMGTRRRQQIRQCLQAFLSTPSRRDSSVKNLQACKGY